MSRIRFASFPVALDLVAHHPVFIINLNGNRAVIGAHSLVPYRQALGSLWNGSLDAAFHGSICGILRTSGLRD